MSSNPFKEGSTSYYDFKTMSDLKWHCVKCELKSGQAKTWQVWRQNGIQLDVDEKNNFYKTMACKNCGGNTVHRKLKSLTILEDTTSRSGLLPSFTKKVKELYKNEEAFLLRQMPPKELEVDHRFPQVRWDSDEDDNDLSMSDSEIKEKFILLTRSNNLLKSRYCEKCAESGIRGHFPGVYFWYQGTNKWVGKASDEKGCVGCFWYDPYKWREELNKLISKVKQ